MTLEFELESFDPAAALPAHMPQGVRWDADMCGPRALMLAVLEDAVQCIGRGRWRRRFCARRLAAEAEAWVRSDDRTYPFSFTNISEVLGIDADAVRARLLGVPRKTRPEVRVRMVTERSPMAVFRHANIHGPPPSDRLEWSANHVPSTQRQP